MTEPAILYFDEEWHIRTLNGNFPAVMHVSDIVNNLTSSSTDRPLSAAMGKALADLINDLISDLTEGDFVPKKSQVSETTLNISLGNGICATGTYTDEKVVSIPNFMLIPNGIINVLFTAPINSDHPTLNVSSTGAKPLRILGRTLRAGVIKAQSYTTLVYDGEAWNIISVFNPDTSAVFSEFVVDMGLPSGVMWAACDIDLTKPGGFCDTPYIHEKSFFSWANIDGYKPVNNSFENVHDYGYFNNSSPYFEGQIYGSTKGSTLSTDIPVDDRFDAARANLGSPWRIPTSAEYSDLFNFCNFIDANGNVITRNDKRTVVNGIAGLYLESTINGNRLFFSCSGRAYRTTWDQRDITGTYWTATINDAERFAVSLEFSQSSVNEAKNFTRSNAMPIRPVFSTQTGE